MQNIFYNVTHGRTDAGVHFMFVGGFFKRLMARSASPDRIGTANLYLMPAVSLVGCRAVNGDIQPFRLGLGLGGYARA